MPRNRVSVDLTLLRPIIGRRHATTVPDPTPLTPLADGTMHPEVNLADRTARYPCPDCGGRQRRYGNGSMAYHGATLARGRRCTFPEVERPHLATAQGLQVARATWPALAPVYDAIASLLARKVQRPHGGQLKHPDKRRANWRWRP